MINFMTRNLDFRILIFEQKMSQICKNWSIFQMRFMYALLIPYLCVIFAQGFGFVEQKNQNYYFLIFLEHFYFSMTL